MERQPLRILSDLPKDNADFIRLKVEDLHKRRPDPLINFLPLSFDPLNHSIQILRIILTPLQPRQTRCKKGSNSDK